MTMIGSEECEGTKVTMPSELSALRGSISKADSLPQVAEALKELEGNVNYLYELVESLGIRLSPILRQEPENDPGDKGKDRKSFSVEIAENIAITGDRIYSIRTAVNNIIGKIEV